MPGALDGTGSLELPRNLLVASCRACHQQHFGSVLFFAMAGEIPQLAVVRFQRDEMAFNFWPLNETQFGAPPRGADHWIQMGNEWWVRARGLAHQDLPPNPFPDALQCHRSPPCPVHPDVLGQRTGVGSSFCAGPLVRSSSSSTWWCEWPLERLHVCATSTTWRTSQCCLFVERVHPGPEIQPAGASSFEIELSLQSRAHLFVDHFPGLSRATAETETLQRRPRTATLPEKTQGFSSVNSHVPDRSHFPTT